MDAVVKGLIKEVSGKGLTDHFRTKGQKNFRAHYLEMWDQVCPALYFQLINHLIVNVAAKILVVSVP